MDYKIVAGRDADELEKKVQHMVDRGWKPAGGIAVDGRCGDVLQAMTSTPESREAAARARDY